MGDPLKPGLEFPLILTIIGMILVIAGLVWGIINA